MSWKLGSVTSREKLPDHLILLPGATAGRWAAWRTLCVRGAGFPAADVLRIADADCAAAADRLAAVEEETESRRKAALEAVRGELEAASKDRLDGLIKAIRRVKRSRPASTEGLAAATAEAVGAWNAAAARLETEQGAWRTAFAAAEERLDRELREIVRAERFREAVVWQNRHAANTGLASFLRRAEGNGKGGSRDRGHAQMLASYVQRYCTKNDTIGFFGPVGWAHLTDSDETIAVRPGKELLAGRQVFFEGWAIDAIADRLAEDEAMRPWLAPRRTPFLRREGDAWVAPTGQRIELGPLASPLLAACDGTRPARALVRGAGLPADKEPILWGVLADFHAKGIVRWAFQVPLSPTPERHLREFLLAIEEEPLRERALAVLDEIERGRDAVARAAGNAGELERALAGLEETFTRTTGQSATRAEGQLYAGRTLVYEDCRRDVDVELGAPFLAEISPALSLVLAGARWFTHFVASGHRELLAQIYAEVSPQAGSPQVDFLAFSRVAMPRLVNIRTHQEIQRELHERWEKVLAIPEGERRVAYRSEDLRPVVSREFAAPGPGWMRARTHSPDLMIAAASPEAIRQGDYQVVLGEVHVSLNTLDRVLFFSQHSNPDELRAAVEADLPEPAVNLAPVKAWHQEEADERLGLPVPSVSGRMNFGVQPDKDFYLDLSLDPTGCPPSQVLAIADLVVEPDGNGGLVVGPRDGRCRFDIVDFYQVVLMMQMIATFKILPTRAYTPRITIDRLVVARESWRVPAGETGLGEASTPAERFVAARRWARRRGLPRFLFAKMPNEAKPFYLDLESPILVEVFARAVRSALKADPEAAVQVSEMLPGHDELWLPDAQGNRYTAELRMVVLDLD